MSLDLLILWEKLIDAGVLSRETEPANEVTTGNADS